MMNAPLLRPAMTREQFLDWAVMQDGRYEFDGTRPVAMTGGSRRHSQICVNLLFTLRSRLRAGPCEPLGPDAGVATIGDAVRYPDALVTCTKGPGSDRIIPGVVAVFEVLSPTSGRMDRIIKLREYQAVASIRRYVIFEHRSIGATVLARTDAGVAWIATTLVSGDAVDLPEIGTAIPLDAIYEGVDFMTDPPEDGSA